MKIKNKRLAQSQNNSLYITQKLADLMGILRHVSIKYLAEILLNVTYRCRHISHNFTFTRNEYETYHRYFYCLISTCYVCKFKFAAE